MDKFLNKIIHGDAFEVLKEIPDCVIDSVICDPPYALSFMGKGWDSFGTDFKKYQEWTRQWAVEALRVAKPGATLLCFGGTRTWHRLACGLEDAGWIIKDTLMWLYGQGFPKATDIKKSGEKSGKNMEKWDGWKSHSLKPAWEPIIMAMKPNEGSYSDNALRWGVAGLNIDGSRIGNEEIKTHHAPKGTFAGGEQDRGSDINYYINQGRFPANLLLECICDEVIEGGTIGKYSPPKARFRKGYALIPSIGMSNAPDNYQDKQIIHTNPECPCYMLDKQSGINASRFFYVAKASKNERNMGLEGMPLKVGGGLNATVSGDSRTGRKTIQQNNHPTVKPLKLMEYLCILTKTPTGGIVLDPFAGSGTTCMAAKKTGRNYIGIELEEEYAKIAEARVGSIQKPLF